MRTEWELTCSIWLISEFFRAEFDGRREFSGDFALVGIGHEEAEPRFAK